MRKFAFSLIAGFCLLTPMVVTGCELESDEKTEQHHHDH